MAAESNLWPVLSMLQRRVLGVMVEKAKTTPDVYPLSLNALTTGCNQKSNRDPVLQLDEDEVAQTLEELQGMGLVTRISSGRVDRWRHNLYDHWTSNKMELAILAELLLRGPQTEGELRGRASRMEPIEDLETLRRQFQPMKEKGLIVFLGDEGRRGTLIAHGFHEAQELEQLRNRVSMLEASGPTSAPPSAARPSSETAQLRAEVTELKETVRRLEENVTTLSLQIRALQESPRNS